MPRGLPKWRTTRTTLEDPVPFFRPDFGAIRQKANTVRTFHSGNSAGLSGYNPSHAGSYELRRAAHNLGQDIRRFPSRHPGPEGPGILQQSNGFSVAPKLRDQSADRLARSILTPGPIVEVTAIRFRKLPFEPDGLALTTASANARIFSSIALTSKLALPTPA